MINREAPELIEALRLQKLRALEHILNHMNSENLSDIAVAIEILEDVYVRNEDGELFEQDKRYDPNSKFSVNSEEILKSLCSFLDIWVESRLSENISFCFLATNGIGKERQTERTKRLGITFLSSGLLEILGNQDSSGFNNAADIVNKIVADFYKENYGEDNQTYQTLLGLSDDLWVDFLKQIEWIFGHPEVDTLELSVNSKIVNYELFSAYGNRGDEEIIKSRLIDMIEKKATRKDRLFKLVQKSDVKNAFLEIVDSSNTSGSMDAVYKLWKDIEKPTDTRNLSEKILEVCPTFDTNKISIYERKASIAKANESSSKNSPKYLALKYRVFDFCYGSLYDVVVEKNGGKYSQEELTAIIQEINKNCVKEFKELKKDYDYGRQRDSVIMELFIDFLDSCYLSFD